MVLSKLLFIIIFVPERGKRLWKLM